MHPLRSQQQIDPAGVTDLASVLDSVHKLFEDDAPSSMDGMYDAHRQLQACMAEEDPNLAFERAHQIIEKGLNEWVWNLRKIAGGIVTNLAEIALANPKWVTEDPASWARSRTKEFLDGWLDGWGTPPTPRILIWLRQACDGSLLDFDRYESGRPEPWCAPTWVGQSRDWTNDPAKLDERSTPELTEKLLRTKRRIFNSSLDYGLEKAEHAARISLAKKPAPSAANNQRHASVELSTKAGARMPPNQKATTKGALNYPRSPFSQAIVLCLTRKPTATDKDLCNSIDEEGTCELSEKWAKNGNRSFVSAYLDPVCRPKIQSAISKVRKDMRDVGMLA